MSIKNGVVSTFSLPLQGSRSLRSFDEEIELINKYKIEKARIIGENIDFITQCPSLKHLWISPAGNIGNGFDYSPVYRMPQIKSLMYDTTYMVYGKTEEFTTTIDCAKIHGLEKISVDDDGLMHYNTVDTLKSLTLWEYARSDLQETFCSEILDTLSIIRSKIRSLDGIQKSRKMQCVYLHYNRSLQDISDLRHVKKTLKALRIENCPKIEDFSVLGELENLELLELSGSNELPSLDFIKSMKNLKTFCFSVNIKDGDLTPCLALTYAFSERNHKHYNLKDKDLPKGNFIHGNESIEVWRRTE